MKFAILFSLATSALVLAAPAPEPNDLSNGSLDTGCIDYCKKHVFLNGKGFCKGTSTLASVSSVDKDPCKLRLDKYTPAAANEARQWIEGVLGERLPSDDLLKGLRDGVALCKLVNLAVGPPGVRITKLRAPFKQMGNIHNFLDAGQAPPLNLQQRDMFSVVDLFEERDPSRVLHGVVAFSCAAHCINPSAFPTSIGPQSSRAGVMSP